MNDADSITDRKLEVFLSSTLSDFREFGESAYEGLLEAGVGRINLGRGPTSEDVPWTHRTALIDRSDLVVLILGSRYDDSDPGIGKSFMQLEYDYALDTGKPVLVLLKNFDDRESDPTYVNDPFAQQDGPKDLKSFREIASKGLTTVWETRSELVAGIRSALLTFKQVIDLKAFEFNVHDGSARRKLINSYMSKVYQGLQNGPVATIYADVSVDLEDILELAVIINRTHLELGGEPLEIRDRGNGIFTREGVKV